LRVRLTRPAATSGSGGVALVRLKALRIGEGTLQVQSLTLIGSDGATRPIEVAPSRVSVIPP
jgi:hypothetical protein